MEWLQQLEADVREEKISITVGSTAAIRILLDTKVEKVPKGLWCYRLHK